MFGGINDIMALDKLLGAGAAQPEDADSNPAPVCSNSVTYLTLTAIAQPVASFSSPADIFAGTFAPTQASGSGSGLSDGKQKTLSAAKKSIWDEEQVPDADDATIPEDDDASDTRQTPQHEILFRQSVKSEDVFLGMNGKDESSRHCEELLVRVTLPDTKYNSIELDTSKTVIRVLSPKYKLRLVLPYPVDHKSGSAAWDSAKALLSVRLPRIKDPDDWFSN